jgi:hypothetical protein
MVSQRVKKYKLPWLDEFCNFLMWEEAGKVCEEMAMVT